MHALINIFENIKIFVKSYGTNINYSELHRIIKDEQNQ